ncbi:MAG: hypothetical protein JXA96_03790 [Sedimentisphaerales bacterium]|nr:hypothetical protein [Sedimentisphaerales bacterium]
MKKNNITFEYVLNLYKKFSSEFIATIVFIVIAFHTLPILLRLSSTGLDHSWLEGLNMAFIKKMQFGKDIIITFGPLGFLFLPEFNNFNTWIISLTFALFVHLLLVYSIYMMIKNLSLNLLDLLVLVIILVFALPILPVEYKLLYSITALLYLSVADERVSKYGFLICILICILMAVVSLLKFTAAITSFSILLFIAVYYLYRKKYVYIPVVLGTYVGSILLLLYMIGQDVVNFLAYLVNSFEISSGYNSAMSTTGNNEDVIAGFCVIGLLLIILVDSILKRKKDLVLFLLINSGFIFISFKHGFVRHDSGHIYIFFSNMLLLLIIAAFTLKAESRAFLQHSSFVLICVLIGFIYHQYPHSLKPRFSEQYRNIYSTVSTINSSPQERDKILDDNKDNMKRFYDLSERTLDYINNKTMDILPWEVSLAYAYNLNWAPRPVFQSYTAYTQKLDIMNAEYYEKNISPDILLYGLETIDGRYNLFDTPGTFRTILTYYEPVLIDKGYLLLQKSDMPNLASSEQVSSIDAKIGESIPIPKIDEGFIFANIYLDYNPAGKILNILYKAPYAMIKIKSGEKEYNHRIIFSTAQNGIFLSQYITNVEELKQVWNNKPLNNLDSFTISVGNKSFYNENIHVNFFLVKPAIFALSKGN